MRSWAGRKDLPHGLVNSRDYDPVTSRFEDTWWPVGREVDAISQSARCYAPSDLSLLLDGTGLRIAAAEVAGEPIDLDNLAGAAAALWDAWEYRVLLVRAGSRARRSKAVGDG